MTPAEIACIVGAGALYAAGFACAARRALRPAFRCIAGALGLHLVSVAIRWAGSGHAPIFGTYEAALAASWFLMLFTALAFLSMHRQFRLLVLTTAPIALLLLAYGALLFDTRHLPLTISERSLWVDFHALFAWLAFAPLTLAASLSGGLLWLARGTQTGSRLEVMDELAYRYVCIGFAGHSVMFALGSYYSSILFGLWWRWDPAFSLSLLAWLLMGLHIHLRLFYHWRGRRAAWSYLVVFALIVFSYWGLIYLPPGRTFHVFDLNLKTL